MSQAMREERLSFIERHAQWQSDQKLGLDTDVAAKLELVAEVRRLTADDGRLRAEIDSMSAQIVSLAAERDAALAKLVAVAARADDERKRADAAQDAFDQCTQLLAESQARCVELRAALEQWADMPTGSLAEGNRGDSWPLVVSAADRIVAALARTADRSALDAAIAEARAEAVDLYRRRRVAQRDTSRGREVIAFDTPEDWLAEHSALREVIRAEWKKSQDATCAYFVALCLGTGDTKGIPAAASIDEAKAALREFGLKVARKTGYDFYAAEALVDAVLRGE